MGLSPFITKLQNLWSLIRNKRKDIMPLVDDSQLHQNHEGAEEVVEVVVTVVEVVELSPVQVRVAAEWRGGLFVVVIVMNQILEDLHTDDGEDVVKYLHVRKEIKLLNDDVISKIPAYHKGDEITE